MRIFTNIWYCENLLYLQDGEFRQGDVISSRRANSTHEELGEIDHRYTVLQRPDYEYL